MKKFIKKHLQNIIRQTLWQINNEDELSRIAILSTQAIFEPSKVRIDKQATIFNNRKEKNYIKIGDNSWLVGQLMTLAHGGEIIIGKDCFIGENTRIWSSSKIVIGNRVLISHNVNIHDNISHPLDSIERHKDFLHVRHIGLQNNINLPEQKILIGDDVWIGFNCVILKGVTIGNKAIIGANTIVTKDVPEMAVVVGTPPRIIKYTT